MHVAGRIDPISDIDVINTELALADLDTVERGHRRAEKDAKTGDKDAARLRDVLKRMREHLNSGKPARTMQIDATERLLLTDLHLITLKPLMYVANVAENGFKDNPYLAAVEKRAAEEGADVVPVCAAIEAEIAQLDEGDRLAFLEELGLQARLDRVIRAATPAKAGRLHRGRERGARVDDAHRCAGAAGGGRDVPTSRRLHPRRSDCLRRLHRAQGRARCKGGRQMRPRARNTSAAKATSHTSASTFGDPGGVG